MQLFLPVEFHILQCVNDVESCGPEHHAKTQKQKTGIESSGDCNESGCRCYSQTDAENNMCQRCESLCVAVPEYNQQCNRAEPQTQFIDKCSQQNKNSG